MNEDADLDRIMTAHAAEAVEHAKERFGFDLDYSPESIVQVERALAEVANDIEWLCRMYGGYIGEVLRRQQGGEWSLDDDLPDGERVVGLTLTNGTRLFPPSKVAKRLHRGEGDSIAFYFKVVSQEASKGA